MKSLDQFLILYLLLINLAALLTMGWDKWRSIENKWRVPEKTLLLLGFIGGGFGLFLGSRAYHHKTRKPLFRIMIPLLMILNILEVYFLFFA